MTYTIDVVSSGCPSTPADSNGDRVAWFANPGTACRPNHLPRRIFDGVDFPEVDGAVWSWTNVNPNNGLAASGEGDIPAWVAPANATTDSLGGPVTIVGQVGSCPVEDAGEFLAIVNQTPTIVATPTETTICSGLSPDGVVLEHKRHHFLDVHLGPHHREVEAFGSEVLLDNQFFNTGTSPADVVFTVTVINALNSAICAFTDEVVTVTVLPG